MLIPYEYVLHFAATHTHTISHPSASNILQSLFDTEPSSSELATGSSTTMACLTFRCTTNRDGLPTVAISRYPPYSTVLRQIHISKGGDGEPLICHIKIYNIIVIPYQPHHQCNHYIISRLAGAAVDGGDDADGDGDGDGDGDEDDDADDDGDGNGDDDVGEDDDHGDDDGDDDDDDDDDGDDDVVDDDFDDSTSMISCSMWVGDSIYPMQTLKERQIAVQFSCQAAMRCSLRQHDFISFV